MLWLIDPSAASVDAQTTKARSPYQVQVSR
jgi:hypothetical protein